MKTPILFFLYLVLSISITTNQAQNKWYKYAGNPVLEKGAAGEWDSFEVQTSCIMWDGSKYQMWYAAPIERVMAIGYATSTDGISWEKYSDNPVLERGAPGQWDYAGLQPTSILFDGTTYQMYYREGVNLNSKTGLATSPDGINWTKDTLNNPVFEQGDSGSWDDMAAWGAHVILENSIYKMWYHGCKNDEIWKIGYAESNDGIEWTKNPEPVMEGNVNETRPSIALPFVIFEENKYSIWYYCTNTSYNSSEFYYATSPDGINWNELENPILCCGVQGAWDDYNIWKPSVIIEGNLYKMWYSGFSGNNWSIGYAEDFSNLVHADSVMIDGIYITPNSDPINILGRIKSPEAHSLTAMAMVVSDDGSIKDSLELIDDGLNGDEIAGDGIYGGYWQVTNEKNYSVGIKTVDEETGFTRNGLDWNIVDRFSSKGPIEMERYDITTTDTIPNPGDRIRFNLTLKNLGKTDTIYDVDVNIVLFDSTLIYSQTGIPRFGDVAPGESLTSSYRDFGITFTDECVPGLYNIGLEISSNDEVYWSDTLRIEVVTPTDIESKLAKLPTEFALGQNFPNPFNPSTKIIYSIPEQSNVTLIVFDVLGREVATLVNKEQPVGNYEVEFDAKDLTSGIYFYRIQAGQFEESKKMVLMK